MLIEVYLDIVLGRNAKCKIFSCVQKLHKLIKVKVLKLHAVIES